MPENWQGRYGKIVALKTAGCLFPGIFHRDNPVAQHFFHERIEELPGTGGSRGKKSFFTFMEEDRSPGNKAREAVSGNRYSETSIRYYLRRHGAKFFLRYIV